MASSSSAMDTHAPPALKKHVITGGPCTGKTTTIDLLRQKGFRTIGEASRILIERTLRSGGDLLPWKKPYEFNVELTRLQQELEAGAREGVHFLDRGVIDNLAYCEWFRIEPPLALKQAVAQARYGAVFILLPLPHFENDPVRKESREEAVRLTELLKKAYEGQGYRPIDVPALPARERVEFILRRV